MINKVKSDLSAILGCIPTLQHAAGAGRTFELYVMTGISLALQGKGYEVWIQRSDGSRVLPTESDLRYIQRGGSPSGIAPAADGTNNPSAIAFRRAQGPTWEMHNGVQFEGRSSAVHEIDIAIIPGTVAHALRNLACGGSPLGRPRISIECKDVGTPGDLDEMRAFIARLYDISLLDAHHPYLTTSGTPAAIHPDAPPGPIHEPAFSYWKENRRTLNVIARRTGFQKGTAALNAYHAVAPYGHITVGSSSSTQLMTDVAAWIHARGY